MPKSPTGGRKAGASEAPEEPATPVTEGKRKPSKAKSEKLAFGGSVRRRLPLEIMGESIQAGPGPGAYLPSSTFGKYAKYKHKAAAGPSPVFRSRLPQRPKPENEDVPGAGAYSPEMETIEKGVHGVTINSGPERFGDSEFLSDSTEPTVGPGRYDSHDHKTLRQSAATALKMTSRQSPGFGVAAVAHMLPHEEAAEDASEVPGPGKYDVKRMELTKADGHNSAFKLPTARKKQLAQVPNRQEGRPKMRRPRKVSTTPDGAVRV